VEDKLTFIHPTYMFQEPGGGFTKTLIKRGQVRVCGDDCPGAVASQPLDSWSDALLRDVEDAAGCAFNCFVANHYANGQVVINWHSDHGPGDDEGLGPNPHIGSLSLGSERIFSLKSKRQIDGRLVHLDVPLTHGSLLIMGNNSQSHWLHALLRDDACTSERINLTFRLYARKSTKHIEGMEHNHEWEAAPGSTRVLLHREGFGRPALVDIPDELQAWKLPRHLATVLPGFRGSGKVCTKSQDGQWTELASEDIVASSLARGKTPSVVHEISVSRRESRNALATDSCKIRDRHNRWCAKPADGDRKGYKGYGKGYRFN